MPINALIFANLVVWRTNQIGLDRAYTHFTVAGLGHSMSTHYLSSADATSDFICDQLGWNKEEQRPYITSSLNAIPF